MVLAILTSTQKFLYIEVYMANTQYCHLTAHRSPLTTHHPPILQTYAPPRYCFRLLLPKQDFCKVLQSPEPIRKLPAWQDLQF
jgi:hypothetical protein